MSNSHTCVICQKSIDTERQGYQAFSTGGGSGAMVHDTCASYIDEQVERPISREASQTRKAVIKDAFDSAMEEFNSLSPTEQSNLYQSFIQEQGYNQQVHEYNRTVNKAGNMPTSLPSCYLCKAPMFSDDETMTLDNRHGSQDTMHKACLAEKLSLGNNGKTGDYSQQRREAINRLRGNK